MPEHRRRNRIEALQEVAANDGEIFVPGFLTMSRKSLRLIGSPIDVNCRPPRIRRRSWAPRPARQESGKEATRGRRYDGYHGADACRYHHTVEGLDAPDHRGPIVAQIIAVTPTPISLYKSVSSGRRADRRRGGSRRRGQGQRTASEVVSIVALVLLDDTGARD